MKIRPQVDYATADFEGFKQLLINKLKELIPEYSDFRDSDTGIVILELVAHACDVLSYKVEVTANESFLISAEQLSSGLRHSKCMDYSPFYMTQATFNQVFEIKEQETDYVIPVGTKLQTSADTGTEVIYFEVTKAVTIPAGSIGTEKAGGEYLYMAVVTQGFSVTGEVVGKSAATISQKFKLQYPKAALDTLKVYIYESGKWNLWTKVSDFIKSGLTDRHYMYEVDEEDYVYILFGNGKSGKIPDNSATIIADYMVSAGTSGNVAPLAINTLTVSNTTIVETFNPYEAITEAVDNEDLESIKINAPASLRTSTERAVIASDFSDLLLKKYSSEILLVKAIETADPMVSVYILLRSGKTLPTEYQTKYRTYLDSLSLHAVTVAVNPIPSFIAKTVDINVLAYNNYTNAEVKTLVEEVVASYTALGNIPIGEDMNDSDLEALIKSNVNGVRRVGLTIEGGVVGASQLPELGTLTVTVTGGTVS